MTLPLCQSTKAPRAQVADRLYVVAKNGNQSFAFNISQEGRQLTLEPLAEYLPMRLFGGKGLVRAGTQAYYDFGDGWIPLIEQRRPRYAPEATLLTPRLDGGEPDCVWHRLLLDACIPPEAKVQVWSRATNEARDLPFTQWHAEPRLLSAWRWLGAAICPPSRPVVVSSCRKLQRHHQVIVAAAICPLTLCHLGAIVSSRRAAATYS